MAINHFLIKQSMAHYKKCQIWKFAPAGHVLDVEIVRTHRTIWYVPENEVFGTNCPTQDETNSQGGGLRSAPGARQTTQRPLPDPTLDTNTLHIEKKLCPHLDKLSKHSCACFNVKKLLMHPTDPPETTTTHKQETWLASKPVPLGTNSTCLIMDYVCNHTVPDASTFTEYSIWWCRSILLNQEHADNLTDFDNGILIAYGTSPLCWINELLSNGPWETSHSLNEKRCCWGFGEQCFWNYPRVGSSLEWGWQCIDLGTFLFLFLICFLLLLWCNKLNIVSDQSTKAKIVPELSGSSHGIQMRVKGSFWALKKQFVVSFFPTVW